jgi:MFS family permease
MYKHQNRTLVWLAWLFGSLFYGYQYILRNLPNVVMPDLIRKFDGLDASSFGQFAGIYYIAYAGLHIPMGIWLDKKGPRFVIPFCILCTVLGTMPLIVSESWLVICLGRALVGFGSSAAILGLFKIIHLGFPENRFSILLGVGATMSLLIPVPLSYVFNALGYKTLITYIVYAGIVLAAISIVVMPKVEHSKKNKSNIVDDLKSIWSRKMILIIGILGGLMIGPLEGFTDVWGASFFATIYGFPQVKAAFLPSLILVGMSIGTIIIPIIANRTKQYYNILIVSAFAMASLFMLVYFLNMPEIFIKIILFAIGIFCAYQVIVIYKAITYASENLVGLSSSIVNMMMMAFGYFFHTVIGKILHVTWNGKMVDGVMMYNKESYLYALSVIPIGLICGGIGFIVVKYLQHKKATKKYSS